MNPGDTVKMAVSRVYAYLAQRRPGRESRRHRRSAWGRPGNGALNEGRDVNPGDTTRLTHRTGGNFARALNEGRDVNPGDTQIRIEGFPLTVGKPLNEGRDVNPGDTRQGDIRRYTRQDRYQALNEGRDVNPGDTVEHSHCLSFGLLSMSAQRRPGRESRRHPHGHVTIRPRTARPLNEGRDVNPGDTRLETSCRACSAPLNEGRDVNPGDT